MSCEQQATTYVIRAVSNHRPIFVVPRMLIRPEQCYNLPAYFMYKKLLTILAAMLFAATLYVDSDAQTRRTRKPVRRPAAAKPKPPVPSAGAVRTASGLIYLITKKGAGAAPKAGDTVLVHYTGTLTDGTKFDSSRDRGKPIDFPLGQGRVIKGWDEGISKLRVGDQAILVIPPTLGYGSRGAGGLIPPNATLIFIVELVDVKP